MEKNKLKDKILNSIPINNSENIVRDKSQSPNSRIYKSQKNKVKYIHKINSIKF